MRKSWSILFALLAFVFLIACNEEGTEDEVDDDLVVPVEVSEVDEGDLTIERTVSGRLVPAKTTPIIISQPGEIDELSVENGDQVKEDDLIAKLKTPMGTEEIRATEDGEIARLEVEEGDFVTEEEPLGLILDLKKLIIELATTDTMRTTIDKSNELKAMIDGESFDAKLLSMDVLPDDTGLYPVELEVKNKDDHLLPGMIAKVLVPEKIVKKSLILPTAAVVEEDESAFVYQVQDDKVIKVEVEILETQSDKTAIKGELEKGDQVVVNGQFTLSNGTQIEVVKEENES